MSDANLFRPKLPENQHLAKNKKLPQMSKASNVLEVFD